MAHNRLQTRIQSDVRFGSKADMCGAISNVRFNPNSDRKSGFPHKVMSALPRTCAAHSVMSALGQKQTSPRLIRDPLYEY